MLALTESNMKSGRIHLRLSEFEGQTAQTLIFNMIGVIRFGS